MVRTDDVDYSGRIIMIQVSEICLLDKHNLAATIKTFAMIYSWKFV